MASAARKRPPFIDTEPRDLGDRSKRSNATRKRPPFIDTEPRDLGDRSKRQRAMARALGDWYQQHRRDLPWRRRANAYATWVSEVMLQQTQVQTVIPYFERWMKSFPTVASLARAPEDAVLGAWQGLGYYSRARNLHRSAREIVEHHDGAVPSDPEQLRKLPGIGRYTAGAIASIAFGKPEPAVDGNVMRVITRLEAWRGDPRAKPLHSRIWQFLAAWLPSTDPSQFNQALMELGALICSPENPRCVECPLLRFCQAQRQGLAERLPELRARPATEVRHVAVLFAEREGSVLLVKQADSARHWAGLHTMPYVEVPSGDEAAMTAKQWLMTIDPRARLGSELVEARFSYPITRFRFEAIVYRPSSIRPSCAAKVGGRFVTLSEAKKLALPAPHRRLIVGLLGEVDRAVRQR